MPCHGRYCGRRRAHPKHVVGSWGSQLCSCSHTFTMDVMPTGKRANIGDVNLNARLNHAGYRVIRLKTERGWRWILEHRWLWQQVYEPLTRNQPLHHRNGVRTDNRLENLERLESPKQHIEQRHSHRTPEYRRKMQLATKGKPKSAQARANIAAANWCRAKTHCKHGHPFNDENTRIRPTGQRVCLACVRTRNRNRPR